ncbi:hypothetical protein R1sor_010918 [Riccia sorocarpa]|uniref:HMA domain-containing protein n=1 Tax=Riccia sorocarpa TaxID=122646 RepID=A0ABD3HZE7_9MARC
MEYHELFSAGYDPPLWYLGYDQSWILGAKGPPWRLPPSKSSNSKNPQKDGPIELYVPICCDACVAKVYKKLKRIEGVATVECNVDKKKVTVTGPAKPAAVLEVARRIKQGAKLWKEKYPPPPRRKEGT